MKGNRIILNSILTAIAIFLLGTAVRLTWLPPVAYTPEVQDVAALSDSTETQDLSPSPAASLSSDSASPLPGDAITPVIADATTAGSPQPTASSVRSVRIGNRAPERMLGNHPYRAEAAKVLSGKLEEHDSIRRRAILNYCEHFRMAYDSKDIDFLRQVFSEDALIIVGHAVKSRGKDAMAANGKVRYTVHSRQTYLDRLARIFNANKRIKVDFSDFHIMRHPTVEGIYGVTLRQKYESDLYSDEGRIFLLWDFRDESMPLIHVRTWQPLAALRDGEDPIEISDFNLE